MTRSRRRHRDTGSATVLVLAAGVVLAVAVAVVVMVAGSSLARHRAADVADLAALAAAQRLLHPAPDACVAARRTAAVNGGRVRSCQVEGATVLVTVTTPAPRWATWLGPAVGRARAGLVSDISEQPGSIDPSS
jgi:secretion/DNA translocation related TadE-like protein